jgi:Ala-tRNA(Pro) deacylase
MTCQERLEQFLREQKASFEVRHHPEAFTAQEIAATEHVSGKRLAKVVMVIADHQLVMLAVPAPKQVDLVKAKSALNAREVRLAKEDEFAGRFPDCDVGAMPPFGHLYDVLLLLDKSLAGEGEIYFQAGTHTETMSMSFTDYERVANPTLATFAAGA